MSISSNLRQAKLSLGRLLFDLRWRIIQIITFIYIRLFDFRTRKPRYIEIEYECEIRDGNLIKDYGNFSMLIQLQRLLTILGHSCEITINTRRLPFEYCDYISDLKSLLESFTLRNFSNLHLSNQSVKVGKINFLGRFTVQFEHFVPHILWMKACSLDSNQLQQVPIKLRSRKISESETPYPHLAWAYRKNPDFPHRNSDSGNFIDYLHFFLQRANRIKVTFLGSVQAREEIRRILEEHSETRCSCIGKFSFTFQQSHGFIGAIDELSNVDFFFSEGGHGMCDFVLGTDLPFEMIVKFSRYHPKKVEHGFPWNNSNQNIYGLKDAFLMNTRELLSDFQQ